MDEQNDRQRQLAVRIAEDATPAQSEALRAWVSRLLDIRGSDFSVRKKAGQALAATIDSKVVWPIAKIVALNVRRLSWDNRTTAQRLGLGAAAVGGALFGGQSAGVAALGGAVAVPLWVVFGAGSMFARYLFEELTKTLPKNESGVTYSVIDAKRVDGQNRPADPRQ